MNCTNYRQILSAELERRKEINESYSLRSFARSLEMSAPRLSQVLSGKSGLSIKAAKDISNKLNLNEQETQLFLNSVGAGHSRSFKEKKAYEERFLELKKTAQNFSVIQLEYFKVISDWYHYAILELTYVKNFKNDPAWISKMLDIDVTLVEEALSRLKKLELLKEVDGGLKDCFMNLASTNDIPSESIKKFNSQLIKKASIALYSQNVSDREISSNIMAIAKADLPLYKEEIRNFRRNIGNSISSNNQLDDVYSLNIQFFSLKSTEEGAI